MARASSIIAFLERYITTLTQMLWHQGFVLKVHKNEDFCLSWQVWRVIGAWGLVTNYAALYKAPFAASI